MSADDRHADEETGSDSELPVEDLKPQGLDAAAEQVKGGIVVTKLIDKASPKLLLDATCGSKQT